MLVQTQAPANAAFETLTGIDLPLNLAVALASPIGGWMVGGMFSRQRRGITSAQMRAHEGSLQQKLREDNQQGSAEQQGSSLYDRTLHLGCLRKTHSFPDRKEWGLSNDETVCARAGRLRQGAAASRCPGSPGTASPPRSGSPSSRKPTPS